MPSFVDDGYTRDDGYIKAAEPAESGERLYDALEFSYRVATRREWVLLDDQIQKAIGDVVKVETIACEFVAGHVKSWSLKNRGGHPVPVTADSAMRMQVHQFKRLYQIIRGNELSDPKPEAKSPPPSDGELLGNSSAVSG
jgi:hypothetical protein